MALLLLGGGCATNEMKGTPFFTGEYAKRNGPAEQRVNAWPIVYYRDPALSVLWPIFEFTDDHTAVRPIFSVYGLDRTNRTYCVLWPLTQFDRQTRENWIFPIFWAKDYEVVFPVYWHFGQPWGKTGGTDSLFPLWIFERYGTNEFSLFCPWPLLYWWSDARNRETGSMVLPLYWHERDAAGSGFYSLLWMSGTQTNGDYWRLLPSLYYQASNETYSATAMLLWVQGRSGSNDWRAIFPVACWDRRWHTLLTPLCGWRHGDRGYVYPLTPLAGVRTGVRSGSWLFPLYSHEREKKTGSVDDNFLLLGGHSREGRHRHSWFWPLFDFDNDGPLDSVPEKAERYSTYGKTFWCLPCCWYENRCYVLFETPPARKITTPEPQDISTNSSLTVVAGGGTNAVLVREYSWKQGVFPLWSYATSAKPDRNRSKVKGSVGLVLYDYRHEVSPGRDEQSGVTNDYTRVRVLWRLWHYERRNGDVSVDVFPAIAYDRKADGFKKTSFLWRCFRYEHNAAGAKKLDVLFIPLMR
jgi:hypothetical protein